MERLRATTLAVVLASAAAFAPHPRLIPEPVPAPVPSPTVSPPPAPSPDDGWAVAFGVCPAWAFYAEPNCPDGTDCGREPTDIELAAMCGEFLGAGGTGTACGDNLLAQEWLQAPCVDIEDVIPCQQNGNYPFFCSEGAAEVYPPAYAAHSMDDYWMPNGAGCGLPETGVKGASLPRRRDRRVADGNERLGLQRPAVRRPWRLPLQRTHVRRHLCNLLHRARPQHRGLHRRQPLLRGLPLHDCRV